MSTTTNNDTEQTTIIEQNVTASNPSSVQIQTSYFDKQVDEFYQYLCSKIIDWSLSYQSKIQCADAAADASAAQAHDSVKRPCDFSTFFEYFCYKIYGEFGIKRKIIRYGPDIPNYQVETHADFEGKDADYITRLKAGNALTRAFYGKTTGFMVQFFYEKTHPTYNKNHPITQLCRHMVFDVNTMSIVSMGVTKAFGYDEFEKAIESQVNPRVIVEEYLEGTMVVYNNRLGQLKSMASEIEVPSQDADESPNHKETATTNKTEKSPRDYAISTRRKLGTSYFNNPGMTFTQMFNDNCASAGVQLNQPIIDGLVLVFNVAHTENKIVNANTVSMNTLVAAFRHADSAEQAAITRDLISAVYEANPSMIGAICQTLATKQLKQVSNLPALVKELAAAGAGNIRTPCVLFEFQGSKVKDGVMPMVESMDMFTPGVMLKDTTGQIRAKLRNNKYTELLNIKGNRPITISFENNNNLFELYWTLIHKQDDSYMKFMNAFNTDEYASNYAALFAWFNHEVSMMTMALFQEYQHVFVAKVKPASSIPYPFKPLCGELHKIYHATRQPITLARTAEFVFNMQHSQVNWRIFGLATKDSTTTGQ